MSEYVYAKHPPHRAALGACCTNCANGLPCVRQALGATSMLGTPVFVIGAGLAIWWALTRKPKPKRRRNPAPSGNIGHRRLVRKTRRKKKFMELRKRRPQAVIRRKFRPSVAALKARVLAEAAENQDWRSMGKREAIKDALMLESHRDLETLSHSKSIVGVEARKMLRDPSRTATRRYMDRYKR